MSNLPQGDTLGYPLLQTYGLLVTMTLRAEGRPTVGGSRLVRLHLPSA